MTYRVCFPFVGDTVGGSHVSATLLIRYLDEARYEPFVLLHREGPLADYLDRAGIAFEIVHGLPYYDGGRSRVMELARLFLRLPYLIRLLRDRRFDLVHTNDGRMNVTWALAARLAGVPHIVHQRTRHMASRLPAAMVSLARQIIAISDYNAGTLPSRLRCRTVVIANPFDTEVAVPDHVSARAGLYEELCLDRDSQIVSFVGSLTRQKRPEFFLEVGARIAETLPGPVFFLLSGRAGTHARASIDEQAKSLGIADRVRFLGFRDDITRVLAGSDLVLAPAINEGHGRVLVEAALAGVPVVAADSGGHREIVNDGEDGLLVPPDNAEAMAAAALSLLTDSHRSSRFAAAAREKALTSCGAGLHATAVQRVYDRVLALDKTMPEVAFVIEGLGGGGAQHVVTTIANHLVRSGRRIIVITFRGPSDDLFRLDPAVTRFSIGGVHASPNWLVGLLANLKRIYFLRRAIRDAGAPVLVGFVATTNILLVLAALGLGRRVIISERNDPERQRLGVPWDWLRRLAYRRADLVTANSRSAIESLSRFVPQNKLAWLPNPLREPTNRDLAPKVGPTILSVGRLHHQKGFDILLAAFANSEGPAKGWRLSIVGDGDLRATLEADARKLGVAQFVDWPGRVTDPFPFYRSADFFVLASRYEGTPNVLLEAMSCGLPCVVNDALPGALEFVTDGESGLVVPSENAHALTAALNRLIADAHLRRRLGAAARQAIAGTRTEDVVAEWRRYLFPAEQNGNLVSV